MSAIKKPTVNKEKTFDNALKYAGTAKTEGNAVAEVKETVPAPVKAKPRDLKEPEERTNFDCPVSLKTELDIFVKQHKHKFKSNKSFIIQCIKDGMEKYRDK